MEVTTTDNTEAFSAIESSQTGTFGARAGARIIDWVFGTAIGFVAGAVGGIALAVMSASGMVSDDWMQRVQGGSFLTNILWGLVATVLAETVSEGIAGATPGKLILGYRVVTTDLQPCTPQAAVIRSLAYFVDSFFFGLPAYNAMKSSSHNQRLGDKWANTIVAKAGALPPRAKRASGLVAVGIAAGLFVHGMVITASVIAKAF